MCVSPRCPAPHGVPGDLRCTVTAPSSLVLPTPVFSEVPSLAWPTIPFQRAPQGPHRWPTGCWIPWAQTNPPGYRSRLQLSHGLAMANGQSAPPARGTPPRPTSPPSLRPAHQGAGPQIRPALGVACHFVGSFQTPVRFGGRKGGAIDRDPLGRHWSSHQAQAQPSCCVAREEGRVRSRLNRPVDSPSPSPSFPFPPRWIVAVGGGELWKDEGGVQRRDAD